MKRENKEHGSHTFSAQYVHGPLRTFLLLALYLVTVNGIFMLLPFVLQRYGINSVGPISRLDYWFIGTTAGVLVAIGCFVRHITVRKVIVDDRQLYAPHYLFPSVPLANITSIQADQYRRGLVMIGVRNQLPRYIHCASLLPVTTPSGVLMSKVLVGVMVEAMGSPRAHRLFPCADPSAPETTPAAAVQ